MSKITLTNIVSGYNPATINANFQAIADHLNSRVLYRANIPGEPNALTNNVDMNGQRMINLPAPASDTEPMRRIDVGSLAQDVIDAKNAAIAAEGSAVNSQNSAVQAAASSAEAYNSLVQTQITREQSRQDAAAALLYSQQAAQSAEAAYNNSRLTAGTVTTGAPGTDAAVTINGDPGTQVINFTIPRGNIGPTGPEGPRGIPGPSGDGTGDVVGDPSPTTIGNLVVWGNIDGKYILNSVVPVTDVERVSRKGQPNGYPPLDASGKIPEGFLYGTPEVYPPINVAPSNGAVGQPEGPTLTSSAYVASNTATHAASQYQVSTVANFASTVWDSGNLGAVTATTIPLLILTANTVYYWRVRYRNSQNVWSDWSTPTSFTTMASFNDYIPLPAATPAVGASFQGGYYAGTIRSYIMSSNTPTTIVGAGTVILTVDVNMTSQPKVYGGQVVRIKSVSSGNYMTATVTAARGTTLTVNVSAASGAGAFSDWEIQGTYRIIVSPASIRRYGVVAPNTTPLNTMLYATDGWRNTNAVAAFAPTGQAAQVRAINHNGYNDWYIPAAEELLLIAGSFKPFSHQNNLTQSQRGGWGGGAEIKTLATPSVTTQNTVPTVTAAPNIPVMTSTVAFQSGQPEALNTTGTDAASITGNTSNGSEMVGIRFYLSQGGVDYTLQVIDAFAGANYSIIPIRRSII